MNEYTTDQDLLNTFNQLAIFVGLKEQKKRQNRTVDSQVREQRLLLIFVFSLINFAIVSILLINLKKSSLAWSIFPLIWIEIASISISIISLLILFYNLWENSRESTQKYIQRIGEDAVVTQQVVRELRKLIETKPQILESIKLHLKSSIEEIQDREKTIDGFSPSLALVIVALGAYILSISIQDLKTS